MKSKLWAGILLFLLSSACGKKPSIVVNNLEGSEWIVSHLQNFDLRFDAPGVYVLRFLPGSFQLNKDLNPCSGEYYYSAAEGSINFQTAICTQVCCDSNFAISMMKFLTEEVENYELSASQLLLYRNQKRLVLDRK